jgi:FMN phosphatase YigB (HAD superfamily)
LTKTLLFDLDDTLLGNDMEAFLPSYLQALAKHLAAYIPPEKMVSQLLAATKLMEQNDRPDCTLEEVFSAGFYPALGLVQEDLRDVLAEFYEDVFPTLKFVSDFHPETIQVVEAVLADGYQIAIATNPLFPRRAVEHRLAWAGLPVEQYDFKVITSYETFHFAKPNPTYYAEILAQLGWPEGPIVMIGDDPVRDIAPARQLGLATFQVKSTAQDITGKSAHGSGSLVDLLGWLKTTSPEQLLPDFKTAQATLITLRSTPAVFDTWCNAMPVKRWNQRSQPPAWSPVEIICHLRDVDIEVNVPRLQKILSSDNPFIPGSDSDRWAEERQYILENGPQALHRFTNARMKILSLLENLSPADWERPARHAIFGPSHLFEMVEISSAHDRLHVEQMRKEIFD